MHRVSLDLEGFRMDSQSTKISVVATVIVLTVASTVLVFGNILNPGESPSESGITSIKILANSSDILYPELMEASFEIKSNSWIVTANFLDDSEGWENPVAYDRTFSVTNEEVVSISDALWESVNSTSPSDDLIDAVLEMWASIGFQVEITYGDGSWVCIWTLQTQKGHILFSQGTGTPNLNMVDATVLEPIDALDGLVGAIYTVFASHLVS
jgi:hypothetical protein